MGSEMCIRDSLYLSLSINAPRFFSVALCLSQVGGIGYVSKLYALHSCGQPEELPHSILVIQLRVHASIAWYIRKLYM